MANINGNQITIDSRDNGTTISTPVMDSFTGISARWNDNSITPAGTLTFTVDGDAGEGGNVINLGAGTRAIVSNTPMAVVDVAVSGLPVGGAVTLYFR